MNYRAKVVTEGVFTTDQLLAGNPSLLVGRVVTIAAGQNLLRGAVLGKITASNKYALSASAANDGSQAPDLILAEHCDATGGDRTAMAYSRGDFNANRVTLGAGHTVASVTEPLRVKGIALLPSVVA
jgi:hypothetical protein